MGNDPWTYFGLWPKRDIERVQALLVSLDVRSQVNEVRESQERLMAWHAWDATSDDPHLGYDLRIHREDLDVVGTKIVEMFPERKFEV